MPEWLWYKGWGREVAVPRVEHAHHLDWVGPDVAEHNVFLVAVPVLGEGLARDANGDERDRINASKKA